VNHVHRYIEIFSKKVYLTNVQLLINFDVYSSSPKYSLREVVKTIVYEDLFKIYVLSHSEKNQLFITKFETNYQVILHDNFVRNVLIEMNIQ
jgi:hypothetical protein